MLALALRSRCYDIAEMQLQSRRSNSTLPQTVFAVQVKQYQARREANEDYTQIYKPF